VTDEAVHRRVVDEVSAAAAKVGLARIAMIESPITGAEGNREFLLHLRADGPLATSRELR
jgi:23S rRNA (cytidine1920-2'-O)/16S rRNA (cytidine1409-2'-O)-methyltransferase